MERLCPAFEGGLAIPNGSYVLVRDKVETVLVQAFPVSDRQITPYCREDGSRLF